jgi:signal transduction histidine kinase
MTWVHTAWLVGATMCTTLGVIHIHVWLRQRRAAGNAAFALLALAVACMGFLELRMMFASTPQEFGRMLWWFQFPVWTATVALVWFVHYFLRAGRMSLAWAAVSTRTLALVINLFMTPSIQFREIVSLDRVMVLGEQLAVPRGTPSPWLAVAHLSLLFLLAFIVDAGVQLWRRGERRRAALIGGSLSFFVALGTVMATLLYWGIAPIPVFTMLVFVPIVLVMAYELSLDLIRTAQLAADLKGSEERTALVADAARAGLWSVDRGSGKMWATPRALAMFGLATGRAHHLDDVLARVHDEDRPRVREFVAESRGAASIEYRVLDAQGASRWYASLGRPGEGTPETLMGATIDIDERKAAEDANARQRAQLEHLARVATVSELSGALAHELNQPLGIIMSNAEAAQRMLESDSPDLAEIAAILDDIVAADQRAGEIIRRLRGMLKPGSPQRQPLPIDEVVRGVVQFMRADFLRRGVSVELRLDAGEALVCADRVPLEQVLVNILTNACDAMAGTTHGDRIVELSTSEGARRIEVRVADRGSGLPDPPEQVFAPFFTTKPDGLGMGLAIARSIVAAHGGRLTAERNQHGGATFVVELPKAEA